MRLIGTRDISSGFCLTCKTHLSCRGRVYRDIVLAPRSRGDSVIGVATLCYY